MAETEVVESKEYGDRQHRGEHGEVLVARRGGFQTRPYWPHDATIQAPGTTTEKRVLDARYTVGTNLEFHLGRGR